MVYVRENLMSDMIDFPFHWTGLKCEVQNNHYINIWPLKAKTDHPVSNPDSLKM